MSKPANSRNRSGNWVLWGAILGAIVSALVANQSYRPDSFWGDLRLIVVPLAAFYGAIAGGVLAGIGLLFRRAFLRGVEAQREYEALPPAQQKTSREIYVAHRVLRVLAPFLAVCFLYLSLIAYSQWKINEESNPFSKKRQSRPILPTPLPLAPLNSPSATLAPPANSSANNSSAQAVLGPLFYPNSQILPSQGTTPRTQVPYSQLMLTTSDGWDKVTAYYRQLLPVVATADKSLVFRGTRSSDGMKTTVNVKKYPESETVYIALISG